MNTCDLLTNLLDNGKVTSDLLERLFGSAILRLLQRIEDGTATPTDLRTALSTCVDQGLSVSIKQDDKLIALQERLSQMDLKVYG